MTTVKYVRANKDYPDFGIKKGERYYVWVPGFRQRTMRSKTPPRQSQLYTGYRSQAYALLEQLEDFENPGTMQALEEFRDEMVSDAESLRDEVQESLDNMPEGLQQGDSGQRLQDRIDALEEFISELESLELYDDIVEDEDLDSEVSEEKKQEVEDKFEELRSLSFDIE